jgi:adenine-specific DNA-methyltransferase
MIHAGTLPVTGGSLASLPLNRIRNAVIHGDCVQVMKRMATESVDFILTDPPYLCRYRPRSGQTVRNDDSSA